MVWLLDTCKIENGIINPTGEDMVIAWTARNDAVTGEIVGALRSGEFSYGWDDTQSTSWNFDKMRELAINGQGM